MRIVQTIVDVEVTALRTLHQHRLATVDHVIEQHHAIIYLNGIDDAVDLLRRITARPVLILVPFTEQLGAGDPHDFIGLCNTTSLKCGARTDQFFFTLRMFGLDNHRTRVDVDLAAIDDSPISQNLVEQDGGSDCGTWADI